MEVKRLNKMIDELMETSPFPTMIDMVEGILELHETTLIVSVVSSNSSMRLHRISRQMRSKRRNRWVYYSRLCYAFITYDMLPAPRKFGLLVSCHFIFFHIFFYLFLSLSLGTLCSPAVRVTNYPITRLGRYASIYRNYFNFRQSPPQHLLYGILPQRLRSALAFVVLLTNFN
jgi:hypothetical protein